MSAFMHEGNHSGSEIYDGLTLRIERLYQRVLRLQTAPVFDSALTEVLRLLAEVMRCDLAYVEVFGTVGDTAYWLGYATETFVRERVSRDLVRIAMMKRKTIEISLPPVPRQRVEQTTALCTPLGGDVPIGVLYVEGITSFASDDRERLETIARHLGTIHTTITRDSRPPLDVQLRDLKERLVREAMERCGSISQAARELGVARTLIYRTLKRPLAAK